MSDHETFDKLFGEFQCRMRDLGISALSEARQDERKRCAEIVRHHMESHRYTATTQSDPADVARHKQAAAALETVLERIEHP